MPLRLKSISLFLSSIALCSSAAIFNPSQAATSYHVPVPPPDAAAIYKSKCAKCHAEDGKGMEKYKKIGQEDFTDPEFQKKYNDAKLTGFINNGEGPLMPAWKGTLKPAEIKALVAHIRAFGKK